MSVYSVDLGPQTIEIPVFDIGAPSLGYTVCVTAGMDGDEYAGIEAAGQIITKLSSCDIVGRVIVCPLVNIPGYRIGHSRNPLDGMYPKRIYPGKSDGSPSERLIWWLHDACIKYSDVWIDLHGGSTEELLTPFIWGYHTGNQGVDRLTDIILRATRPKDAVYEIRPVWQKVLGLARQNKTYLIYESGSGRKNIQPDSTRLTDWVMRSLWVLGLLSSPMKKRSGQTRVWSKTVQMNAPYDCFWQPTHPVGTIVKKNDLIGVIATFSQHPYSILASVDGKILWQKQPCPVAKNETLVGIATA